MFSGIPPQVREGLLDRSALNRFVNPNEIAKWIDFIIDPNSIALCSGNFEINRGSFLGIIVEPRKNMGNRFR